MADKKKKYPPTSTEKKKDFQVEELDSELEDVAGGSCDGCDSCAGGHGSGCEGCGDTPAPVNQI